MEATTKDVPKRLPGRPQIPFDELRSSLRLFPRNKIRARYESVGVNRGYTPEQLLNDFAELVIERGLDALEHDQTCISEDGSNLDHAVTYPSIQE